MKRTMLAILAISPLMMHAQVKSSAQPGSTPTFESSNIQPAAIAGIHSSESAAAPTAIRVSTGVKAPMLVYSADVDRDHILEGASSGERVVRVAMTVDASGKPTNLKVVQSTDMFTDQAIVTAASQYRFKPATLDGTAVPMEMTVNFKIVN
jgi:TonB family protein